MHELLVRKGVDPPGDLLSTVPVVQIDVEDGDLADVVLQVGWSSEPKSSDRHMEW